MGLTERESWLGVGCCEAFCLFTIQKVEEEADRHLQSHWLHDWRCVRTRGGVEIKLRDINYLIVEDNLVSV